MLTFLSLVALAGGLVWGFTVLRRDLAARPWDDEPLCWQCATEPCCCDRRWSR